MTKKLPDSAQKVIHDYVHLPLGGKEVVCPYFIIPWKKRKGTLRVMAGKGSPDEIVQETLIYAKLKGIDLNKLDEQEIRKFMMKVGIGIDCSAFVVHVIEGIIGRSIKKVLNPLNESLLVKWVFWNLKPVQNINVDVLTHSKNAESVELKGIKLGDLIRARGLKHGNHVLLVSKVESDENEVLRRIGYVHSTRWYDDQNGVRKGEIIVRDENLPLEEQEWREEYKERNWTHEEYVKDLEYSGIYRLKRLKI